jgi:hypothetical protein
LTPKVLRFANILFSKESISLDERAFPTDFSCNFWINIFRESCLSSGIEDDELHDGSVPNWIGAFKTFSFVSDSIWSLFAEYYKFNN